MTERVKVFTFVTGHGTSLLEPPIEEHINQWLASVRGRFVRASQSESERAGSGHHVTICIWYTADEQATTA